MGADKAALVPPGAAETQAQRTGRLLAAATSPALEVGPGRSGLPSLADEIPGAGPLAAIASGWRALRRLGWAGPVLVVATDLPRLSGSLLAWLADHPSPLSVVPESGGTLQPLCARYSARDLERAAGLVAGGCRAARELLRGPLLAVPQAQWAPVAGDPRALEDADTADEWLAASGELGDLREGEL